ncbi:MAG: hypothetical protein ABL866_05510 [Devosia sp.]
MSDLLRTIAIVVTHTPIWVWGLYGLLLFLGWQRTRDSSVSLVRMLILPLVVAVFAISSFIGGGLSGLPVMLVGLVIGGTGGWLLERDGGTRRLADGRIWLRGEWWSFAQIAVVLNFRYATNVIPIFAPALNANPMWNVSSLFLFAALPALFLGRTAARLNEYFSRVTEPA